MDGYFNCSPLLADLILYSYEAQFIEGLMKAGKKNAFSRSYRHMHDVLSLNISKFSEYLEFIYPRLLDCVSILLALRLPRLGKRELILVLFCTFVRFALVCFCRFPLPLGVWEGLRFVIVALPGLFFYLL